MASPNNRFKYDKIISFLLAEAKLGLSQEDDPNLYWPHFDNIHSVIDVLLFSTISYHDEDIKNIMRLSLTGWLQDDLPDDEKWGKINAILEYICSNNFVDKEPEDWDIFFFLYNMVEEVSSDHGIKCNLLQNEHLTHVFFDKACKNVEVLKFLLSKGVSMDEECISGSNFLDIAAESGHSESVTYLLSIGVRPKNSLRSLSEQNSCYNSKVKQLIEEEGRTPASLRNICRLRVNKSLNVEKASEILPRSIRDFVNFM